MRGPHAHGAMAARPMARGAAAGAAQHVRVSGAESTGKARKTRSRSARRERSDPRPPRRGQPRRGNAAPSPGPGGERGRAARSALSQRGGARVTAIFPPQPLLAPGPGRRRSPRGSDTCAGPECRRPLPSAAPRGAAPVPGPAARPLPRPQRLPERSDVFSRRQPGHMPCASVTFRNGSEHG